MIAGKCIQSALVGSSDTVDEFECLAACQTIGQSCKWFTYFSEHGLCQSFAYCTELDSESCIDCISGESACTAHPEPVCKETGIFDQIHFIQLVCTQINFGGDSLVKARGLRGPLNYLSISLLAFIKSRPNGPPQPHSRNKYV